MKDNTHAVKIFIDTHLERYLDEVCELCAQPSVSAQNWGMTECGQLVEDLIRRHGGEAETYDTPRNPVVVGRFAGHSDRTLLLYNHYDVQPVEPLELWTNPPFEPTRRDGKIFGRGTKDDKGEWIARLAAIDALRAAYGGTLPCSVICVVEGDEEMSSPHIREFVRQHQALLGCEGAIWEGGDIGRDGYPIVPLGVRGILEVELSVRTLSHDAHSGNAHILPNAAWRLLWAVSALKGPDETVRIPGFYERVQTPSEQDLAYFTSLWEANPALAAQLKNLYDVRSFAGGRTGEDLLRSVFSPTCNIQGIGSGYQGSGSKTIVPSVATAKIDFRLVPGQDPEDIAEKLRSYLDRLGFRDVDMTVMGWMGPARTDPADPLVRIVTDTAAAIYGGSPALVPLIGGSSPGYAFADTLGIPVVTAGIGYWDNRPHAPNEHFRIEDFIQGTRHLAAILDAFSRS